MTPHFGRRESFFQRHYHAIKRGGSLGFVFGVASMFYVSLESSPTPGLLVTAVVVFVLASWVATAWKRVEFLDATERFSPERISWYAVCLSGALVTVAVLGMAMLLMHYPDLLKQGVAAKFLPAPS